MAISTRHRWLNGLLAGTLCVVAACVVQQAAVLMAADWTSSVTRHDVGKWATGAVPHTPEQWEQARRDLQEAIALTPRDATLHDALAQLHGIRGRELWTTGAADSPEVAAYREALVYQEASIRLRPTHAMAWANLALMQYAVNETPDALFKSWREAARLGPREGEVTETLVYIATQIWPFAPDDIRQWVETRKPGLSAKLDASTTQP
jgi:tetratricopeptide (TPR) repeat protein